MVRALRPVEENGYLIACSRRQRMLSCAKLVLETVIASGSKPDGASSNKLGQMILRELADRLTVQGELFSHRKVRDSKANSVVKTGDEA
jgi:hypothetical protein